TDGCKRGSNSLHWRLTRRGWRRACRGAGQARLVKRRSDERNMQGLLKGGTIPGEAVSAWEHRSQCANSPSAVRDKGGAPRKSPEGCSQLGGKRGTTEESPTGYTFGQKLF